MTFRTNVLERGNRNRYFSLKPERPRQWTKCSFCFFKLNMFSERAVISAIYDWWNKRGLFRVQFEIGSIAAFRDRNYDGIVFAFLVIIFFQSAPQPSGMDSNNRIDLWIKIGFFPERLHPNRIFFQSFVSSS